MGLNVLAFTAINPARRYPQAEARILQLENVARFVFDASETPGEAWYQNIFRKYKSAREMCLRENFDALLTAESDMLIPRDAVTLLASNDAPIAYGLYCLRHGVPAWNVFVALDEDAGFSLSDILAREHAPQKYAGAMAGQPLPIYGAGFGCTLIRREVLEQIEFRNLDTENSFYTDWLFAADANARGIRQVMDPRVVCGHIAGNGMVLFPDTEHEHWCRADYLTAQVMEV